MRHIICRNLLNFFISTVYYRVILFKKFIRSPYGKQKIILIFLTLSLPFYFFLNRESYFYCAPPVTKIEYIEVQNPNVIKEPFAFTETQIAEIYLTVEYGGRKNVSKKAQNVAIIVPYRNRASHLSPFLRNIHYFLNKQFVNYGIFVVEQIQNQTFNKARVMNSGFIEISKDDFWDCFIFHDIDLLPENLKIRYKCEDLPLHFSPAVDKFDYVVYEPNFGGVIGMSKEYFIKINGYSNEFWGWGGEDDAIRERIYAAGGDFRNLPYHIGRYQMHRHPRDTGNDEGDALCLLRLINETSYHYEEDGLTTLQYKLLSINKELLYTHLLVDLEEEKLRNLTQFKC